MCRSAAFSYRTGITNASALGVVTCASALGMVSEQPATLQVPNKTRTVGFNQTQPLIATGQVRWALNNIAHDSQPPCTSILQEVYNDPNWAVENAASQIPTFSNLSSVGIQVCTSMFNRSLDVLEENGE